MFTIRDDVSTSLSLAERDLIVSTATRASSSGARITRIDGRGRTDRRPVQLDLVRGDNRAVATVKLGAGTRATATCTGELGPPPAGDRPNEGSVSFPRPRRRRSDTRHPPRAVVVLLDRQRHSTTSSSRPIATRNWRQIGYCGASNAVCYRVGPWTRKRSASCRDDLFGN